MKKNVMMRIASILLVCVLATTCGISGTFAKYVTKEQTSDVAQVAKWGVSVTATSNSMFNPTDGFDVVLSAEEDAVLDAYAVKADGDYNVVAPGTDGEYTNFVIEGTPEVAVRVTYAATITLAGWSISGDWDNDPATPDTTIEYCPIIFTIEGTDYKIDWEHNETVDDFADRVEAAIVAHSKVYDPNTDLASKNVADELNIEWRWEFFGEDNVDSTLYGYQTDKKDTTLGDLAVTTAPTITIVVTCTVTQID